MHHWHSFGAHGAGLFVVLIITLAVIAALADRRRDP